jgi:protease YdgD
MVALLGLLTIGTSSTQPAAEDGRITVRPEATPWNAIGRLNVSGYRARRHCTATLVEPRVALTAWHCLLQFFRNGVVNPRAVHFLPGYDRGTFHEHLRGISYERVGDDVVLVTLSDISNLAPVRMESVTPVSGDTLFQAGYSADRSHVLTADPACTYLGPTADGRWLHNCEAVSGDSGAPILRDTGNGLVVVAIHVGRTADGTGIAEPLR